MKAGLSHTIEVLRSPLHSKADDEYLYSQLLLLCDLRQYLFDLSASMKKRLLSSLRVEEYTVDTVIFRKGDFSDKLYIILYGALDMYDDTGTRSLILIATVGVGKIIGERGLVRKTSRMLTAKAHCHSYLLTLDYQNFKSLLEPAIALRMEEKVTFLDSYLPKAKSFLLSVKERLAYALFMGFYRRGVKLTVQGEVCSTLFFVKSGECSVTHNYKGKSSHIVTLTAGCWFGDESVFLQKPCAYTISVSSEGAWLYSILKSDALKFIPDASAEVMRLQCLCKDKSRQRMTHKLERLTSSENAGKPLEFHRFKLASSAARRSILRAMERAPTVMAGECRDGNEAKKRMSMREELILVSPYHNRHMSDCPTSRLLTTRTSLFHTREKAIFV